MQGQMGQNFESALRVKKLLDILLSSRLAMVIVSPGRGEIHDVSVGYWTQLDKRHLFDGRGGWKD